MYSYINQKKNCISGSNNIYTDFPALMSSGGFPVISSAYQNNKRVKQKIIFTTITIIDNFLPKTLIV